jgi:23S rRNA (uracil1939-C5)-methyltransferase
VTADGTDLEILRLGAQGDGIAAGPDGPVYVPFALPGERVRPVRSGLPEIVSAPSPERQAPVCRHFGVCGGCVTQHMRDVLYAEWKRGIVAEAFRQQGIDVEIAPLLRVSLGSRRRVVLTAKRSGAAVTLGFHRRASHEVLDIAECPVTRPDIVAALPVLREIVTTLAVREARITVLATSAGLDVAVDVEGRVDGKAAAQAAQTARSHRIARVSIAGEPVMHVAKPALDAGGVAIVPPPGAFVQAVAEAEQHMADSVLAATGKAKRVVDLFAGIGTFAVRLARRASVVAIDSDKAAIAALSDAIRQTQGLKPIETRVRDLFRDPLSPRELDAFDAAVFDPPRAGAKAQSEALAKSKVQTVVAVSCNPATLARDVRSLRDGGYRLERVMPIDQFLYAAHVEVVAVLKRPR